MNPAQKHLLKTWIAALLWLGLIAGESTNFASAETHQPNSLPAAAFPFWAAARSLSRLAFLYTQVRPLHRLLHAQLASVPRLARHLSIPREPGGQCSWRPNFFFHDCPGGVSRTSWHQSLHSQPDWKSSRRAAGQYRSTHRADSPVRHRRTLGRQSAAQSLLRRSSVVGLQSSASWIPLQTLWFFFASFAVKEGWPSQDRSKSLNRREREGTRRVRKGIQKADD